MTEKYFLDTNLFVYLFSDQDSVKQNKARNKLSSLSDKQVVLSTQVLQELSVVLAKKMHFSHQRVKQVLRSTRNFELVQISFEMITGALDLQLLYQLSFWDSLIIQAAREAECTVLLTEDLNHGQHIQGIEIRNPFM